MKKILIIFSLILLSFSNIFAYEKNFKYKELEQIQKNDFAIIIFEDENGSFEFKNKKYETKFGVKFLENYKGGRTKVTKNKDFLEKFQKNEKIFKNYFLIRVDKSKNIDAIKVEFEADFEDFKNLSKKEFLEIIKNNDFLDLGLASFSKSDLLKNFLIKRNIKMKYLFEEIGINKEILEYFEKKLDTKNIVNKLFLKLLENEVYNNGENINLYLNLY